MLFIANRIAFSRISRKKHGFPRLVVKQDSHTLLIKQALYLLVKLNFHILLKNRVFTD